MTLRPNNGWRACVPIFITCLICVFTSTSIASPDTVSKSLNLDSASIDRSTSSQVPSPRALTSTPQEDIPHPILPELMREGIGANAFDYAESEQDVAAAPCSAAGCSPYSSNEMEDCVPTTIDTVNGGCVGASFKYTLLAPFSVICGQSWAQDVPGQGYRTDVDWFLMNGVTWGDSITWCITAEFDFDYGFWDWGGCPDLTMRSSGSGTACDTICVSMRTTNGYQHVISIRPAAANPITLACASGPWNYHISLVKHCDVECPPGSVDEGEGCSADPSVDNFNGGCFSSPQVFSTITPGQPVCGQVSSLGYSRDSDWYRTAGPLVAGDFVSFSVTANFPSLVAIFDLRRGCITREVAGAYGQQCTPTTLNWKVDSGGVYCFVVGALQTDYGYPCGEGPWRYTATLRDCALDCLDSGTLEGEDCVDLASDNFNGGCNSGNYALQEIAVGERICGQTWMASGYRDTDWYTFFLERGDVVQLTVRAQFRVKIGVLDWSAGCVTPYLNPVTTGWDICSPTSMTFATPVGGQFVLFVAPDFDLGTQALSCANGPWKYDAIVEYLPCECQCHADPHPFECDDVTNVFDIIEAVNIAFRGSSGYYEPSVKCPYKRVDVNCDGFTNILDVTRLINVAFRGGNPFTELCDPCAQ